MKKLIRLVLVAALAWPAVVLANEEEEPKPVTPMTSVEYAAYIRSGGALIQTTCSGTDALYAGETCIANSDPDLENIVNITLSGNIVTGSATGSIILSGGSTSVLGSNVVLYAETHATQAGDALFRSSATTWMDWDQSASEVTVAEVLVVSNTGGQDVGLSVASGGIDVASGGLTTSGIVQSGGSTAAGFGAPAIIGENAGAVDLVLMDTTNSIKGRFTAATSFGGGTSVGSQTNHALSLLTNNTEKVRVTTAGDVAVASTAKLYLDGVAATGDSYFVHSAADVVDLYVGGLKALSLAGATATYSWDAPTSTSLIMRFDTITAGQTTAIQFRSAGSSKWLMRSDGTYDLEFYNYTAAHYALIFDSADSDAAFAGDISIPATMRFYPDGGGDTYIAEGSANVVRIVTGGTTRLDILSSIRGPDGTAAAPAWTFLNETDGGMYRAGTNSVGFAAGGSAAFTIDGSGILDFLGTYGTSTKNPAAVAEDAWLEIKLGGTTYYIPLYTAS